MKISDQISFSEDSIKDSAEYLMATNSSVYACSSVILDVRAQSLNSSIEKRVNKDLGILRFWPQIQFRWPVSLWASSPSVKLGQQYQHSYIYTSCKHLHETFLRACFTLFFFFLIRAEVSSLLNKQTTSYWLQRNKTASNMLQNLNTKELP